MDYGIIDKFGGNLNLIGYSDCDWAGSINDMKSTSGYAFLFGSSICSWLSKKQGVVAQSTAEAEYVSASKATSQAIWLRRIFEDIGPGNTAVLAVVLDFQSPELLGSFHKKEIIVDNRDQTWTGRLRWNRLNKK
uniref:Reverse transcriptase Ty1/copia-type domain-containing protein n=1 Tax=Solanum lycopersicum TaxID=4081 RepID=A0A3Q7FXY7_SOLLC